MKKYVPILKRTRLFSGISEEELTSMLSCLDARVRDYKRGEYVFRAGERISYVAVLVSGEVHIQSDDYWGNRTIISRIGVGESFGESYISSGGDAIQSDAVALEDSTVVFFDVRRVITVCPSACRHHGAVVENLLFALSEKNRTLVAKLGHISKRTTREKLISYLSEQARKNASPTFTVPFNRRQLAEYLSVDRSAMSNELCKMRNEGLLRFDKNKFELLNSCKI